MPTTTEISKITTTTASPTTSTSTMTTTSTTTTTTITTTTTTTTTSTTTTKTTTIITTTAETKETTTNGPILDVKEPSMADQAALSKTYFNISLMDKDMNIDNIGNDSMVTDLIIPDIVELTDLSKGKEVESEKDPDCRK